MALTNQDQASIREYLLGKLNDDEQQKIEERLMIEDELFDELEILKGELIEEYCAGELARTEREWFERHFLASPEGKQRYAFTVALDRFQRPSAAPQPALHPTVFQRLNTLFKQQPWAFAAATSLVLVVIVAAIFLPRRGQTVVGPTLAISVMNREGGPSPEKITLPANASELRIRLLLPQPSVPNASYRAELDDRTEFKPAKVIEYDREAVSVVIPARQLPRGEYSLTLVAITPEGEKPIPGDYFFIIE